MNKKIVGIFFITLLFVTISFPVFGIMNKDTNQIRKKMVEIHDDKTLMEPVKAFLSGRINNKRSDEVSWFCNAVNLRIIVFDPIHSFRYTDGESLEVMKPGLGIFLNRFIFGYYRVWL
jgi:hypothetical protein